MKRLFVSILLVTVIVSGNSLEIAQMENKELHHGETVIQSVRFLRDGNQLVSAGYDGTVTMWDTRSSKRVWRFGLDDGSKFGDRYTTSHILGMDVSPKGDFIAVSFSRNQVVGDTLKGPQEYAVALLNSATGKITKVLAGHTALIGGVSFSPDGRLLASESGDCTARIWDVASGRQILLIKLNERGAGVAFSPDGQSIAVATQPTYNPQPMFIVGIYDVSDGRLLREFPRLKNAVTNVVFSPVGQKLAIVAGDQDGTQTELWETKANAPTRIFTSPGENVSLIAFSPDGSWLATGGPHSNNVVLIPMTGAGVRSELRVGAGVSSFAFSLDSTRLAVGTEAGRIAVLQISDAAVSK